MKTSNRNLEYDLNYLSKMQFEKEKIAKQEIIKQTYLYKYIQKMKIIAENDFILLDKISNIENLIEAKIESENNNYLLNLCKNLINIF